ncbi:hypothetical protein AB0A71_41370 [Kitasatospora aureofaciens]|uniref:hypothetical protein n=1 Tax=Kitasatospora aureofaciens TaxID=1894 RepID=UPI0033C92E89
MDLAEPAPPVDTAVFRPVAMRPSERAAVLERLLLTPPSPHRPGNRISTHEQAGLGRLWSDTLQLRPILVTILRSQYT